MPISARTESGTAVPAAVARPLAALVRAALALEGRRAGEVAIVLADDPALRDLNRRWRGIDRATDVLSFSYDEGPAAARTAPWSRPGGPAPGSARARPPVHGDLVISLGRMREQARRFGVAEGEELARLVVHGTLHLAGLDHQRPAERRAMRVREDEALARGVAAVRALRRSLAGPVRGRGNRT